MNSYLIDADKIDKIASGIREMQLKISNLDESLSITNIISDLKEISSDLTDSRLVIEETLGLTSGMVKDFEDEISFNRSYAITPQVQKINGFKVKTTTAFIEVRYVPEDSTFFKLVNKYLYSYISNEAVEKLNKTYYHVKLYLNTYFLYSAESVEKFLIRHIFQEIIDVSTLPFMTAEATLHNSIRKLRIKMCNVADEVSCEVGRIEAPPLEGYMEEEEEE